ncbi:MAG: glycosyltransferase, partial [Bacteroidota bacterium]
MREDRMIIVFIGGTNKFTRPGGIPSYFYELQNYLQVSLDNAYFLEIGEEERLEHQHILYGTLSQNFFVRAWKMRQVLRKLKKRHKKLVFSIHYWRELIFSLDMILQGDVIMHFHGPAWMEAKIEKKSPIYVFLAKQYEHLFYQKSKLIICLSEHYKNLLIDEYKIEPRKIVKIPFGFKIAQKSFYAQPSKSQVFHIICVRRLANRMGLDLLI